MSLPRCPLCGNDVIFMLVGVGCVVPLCTYQAGTAAHRKLAEMAAEARAWKRLFGDHAGRMNLRGWQEQLLTQALKEARAAMGLEET